MGMLYCFVPCAVIRKPISPGGTKEGDNMQITLSQNAGSIAWRQPSKKQPAGFVQRIKEISS